jgi:Carboxypeptidase regulatory-like domain/von Willebrand factor type A domain
MPAVRHTSRRPLSPMNLGLPARHAPKSRLMGAIVLLATATFAGCESVADAVSGPPEPTFGDMGGFVEDQFGQPLAGATLTISGPATAQGTTVANGSWLFTGLPIGVYTVRISMDGFVEQEKTRTVSSGQLDNFDVALEAESLPSTAVVGARVVGRSGSTMQFSLDVVVLGAQSSPIAGLTAGDFTIGDFASLVFSRTAVSSVGGSNRGAYSAVLLMDQSGSIQSTDPTDSRLQAGKIFFNALVPPDNAILAAFSSSGNLPFSPVTTWGKFGTPGSTLIQAVDGLSGLEGGGTPLYRATASMISSVSASGGNANKAVIVFTDGEDTDGGVTLDQVVSLANSRGVSLFTVGLSNSVDTGVLGRLAHRTGGAMMWASDARQLVSLYGSLGNILRGTLSFYRTQWSVTAIDGAVWNPGAWIRGSVRISTPEGIFAAPFFVEVP